MSAERWGDVSLLPKTRAEAKALGSKWYFTGKPCKHGHVEPRKVSNGSCARCERLRWGAPQRTTRRKAYYEANRAAIIARQKAYREANREAVSAQQKAYREANREAVSARQKAYREANREERLAKKKAYYEANREAASARQKAYREANREAVSARQKAYYEANREELLARGREWARGAAQALDGAYVKQRLAKQGFGKASEISPTLVELKRLQIQLKRDIKKGKSHVQATEAPVRPTAGGPREERQGDACRDHEAAGDGGRLQRHRQGHPPGP